MAVIPFLNNAATVLMMAPIAAGLAANLKLNPDPFLMAVAIGAGLRLPHAHRPPVQHAGDGAGRLPFWRLLAPRPAAFDHRGPAGRTADRPSLAAPAKLSRCSATPRFDRVPS